MGDEKTNYFGPGYPIKKDETKAAESESFSLSKPKQIEDVMDGIATEEPASSSEFASMNEELKKRLARGEKIRHENVKFIWDSSHAKDAEEIADWVRRDKYSQKVRTDQAEQIAELAEENQRLRTALELIANSRTIKGGAYFLIKHMHETAEKALAADEKERRRE